MYETDNCKRDILVLFFLTNVIQTCILKVPILLFLIRQVLWIKIVAILASLVLVVSSVVA